MTPERLLCFLNHIEKLKCNTRHSWTSSGRRESVAEHSWRLSMMAYLVKDEVPEVDMNKVILMSICHDLGEAVTGDIPAFWKNADDEKTEEEAVYGLLEELPEEFRRELTALFEEMWKMETPEARLVKALDKIEALISHEEASIDTWLPLEYEKNLVYGRDEVKAFDYTKRLWDLVQERLENKVEAAGKAPEGERGSETI